MLKKNTIK